MKTLRHIGIGFLVSFVGSLPLGYLNVVGLGIFRQGFFPTVYYLLGVVSVEVFVIYFSLVLADKLSRKAALLKAIEAFSVLFLMALAVMFYVGGEELNNHFFSSGMEYFAADDKASPYLLGISLSCLNFMQFPFWIGWNLYLLNKKHIEAPGIHKYFYVAGTAVGTFFGMLGFIVGVDKLEAIFLTGYLLQIIAIAFAVTGLLQAWKFYRKYYKKQV